MKKNIQLYPPSIPKSAQELVNACLVSNVVSTGGGMVVKFEKLISKFTKSKFAVAFNSGSSALQIAIKVLNIRDTEIVVPTLTFVATVNAVIHNNCLPIFMDCDDYFNIDIKKVLQFFQKETFIKNKYCFNKKTKRQISAIIITHVWGNAAEIKKLKLFCKKINVKIIEDASESLGTFYKKDNKHTGTVGDIGVLSFNANKIITTGGGGMILTNKKVLAKKAKHLSTQAKANPVYFIHDDVGYNLRLTNIPAAIGIAQLKQIKIILRNKKKVRKLYENAFKSYKDIKLIKTPEYAYNNFWMNVVCVNSSNKFFNIKKKISMMLGNGIQVRPIWQLNHLQKPFKKYQNYKIKKSVKLHSSCICVPSSPDLSKKEIDFIVKVLNEK